MLTLSAAATVLLVGLASGAASTVLAWAELFAPLRARLTGRAAYLAGCPICLGGWISLALTALQGVPEGLSPLVAWWAAWGVSCLVAAGLSPLASVREDDLDGRGRLRPTLLPEPPDGLRAEAGDVPPDPVERARRSREHTAGCE